MVVNVARGDLVNDSALFADVNEGRVSGIGFSFDVYRNEPHIDERWLSLANATLLPHIGSATQRRCVRPWECSRVTVSSPISMASRLPTYSIRVLLANSPQNLVKTPMCMH